MALNPLWIGQQAAVSMWPDSTNTGFVNAPGFPGTLTPFNGTITSNTTYNFRSFVSQVNIGTTPTPVANVIFNGCQFVGSGGVGNMATLIKTNGPLQFNYCSFQPQGVVEPGPSGGVTLAQSYQFALTAQGSFGTFCTGSLLVDHCDIWGFGNAVGVQGGNQANPHIYQNNYVHDMCLDSTYHGDGIGCPGGGVESYTVIRHNNIQALGNTQGLAYQNSAVGSTWSNFTITNNLIGGWGYGVAVVGYAVGDVPNITFTDNTYSTGLQAQFGPLYSGGPEFFWTAATGGLWRRNRWLVPPNAAWGHSQYSGYYWLPGTIGNAPTNPDELAAGLVGLTDYTG